jgi:hypothetical protein
MARPTSREELTTVGGLSLLGAFGSFIVAIIFGTMMTVKVGSGEAPNITAAGAACGFAVASGLCLLAAAIAESGAKRRESPPSRTTDSPPTIGPG